MSNIMSSKASEKDAEQQKKLDKIHTVNTTTISKILSFLSYLFERIPPNGTTHELMILPPEFKESAPDGEISSIDSIARNPCSLC